MAKVVVVVRVPTGKMDKHGNAEEKARPVVVRGRGIVEVAAHSGGRISGEKRKRPRGPGKEVRKAFMEPIIAAEQKRMSTGVDA